MIAILTWHSLVQVSLDIQERKELSHGQKDIKMDRQLTHEELEHSNRFKFARANKKNYHFFSQMNK